MLKHFYSGQRQAALLTPLRALLLSLLFPTLLFSQTSENCTNGIDDDGDGLIDCYDQDCTCTGQCDDFYYTTCNADCFYIPPCGQISLGIQWTGQAETGTYSPIVAGDMDQDGVPEIVTYWVENDKIYILDGATGATKVTITSPTTYAGGTAPAMADLDNDGFGEFVIVGNDRLLRCYSHTGVLKFTGPAVGYDLRYRFSVPNIADFDHDGWPEVNIGNQVFSGQTGALLAQAGPGPSAGEHPVRAFNGFSFAMPVAIDALPDSFCPDCDGLEIVAGNQVLSVNLVTGVVAPVVTAAGLFSDGYTSVADIDRDGDLDAVVQGWFDGKNCIYAWEIENSTIMRQFLLPTNWHEGASRANIADLNGDGQLEVSFVEFPFLYALKNDFSLLWKLGTNDASSITCSSVFDFCGDGSADVIYRGQSKLQILEGATGQVKWEDDCVSATHIEAPLVLDVDADGQTEVVIECGTNGSPDFGKVVAYEAVGLPGIASRRVWNQHAYFNTNINDDLSVPRYQQNPHIIGDSLKMNTFLNQFFNPTFPSPDGLLSIQQVDCVGDSLDILIKLCNPGDKLLPATMPVSFYRGNPQTTAAQWVGVLPTGIDLLPDSCRSISLRVPRVANDSVFVVLNDNHSKPAPFNLAADFPVTAIGECNFTNNIAAFYFDYNPAVVNLGADTTICDNATVLLKAGGANLIDWKWQDNSVKSTFLAPDAGSYAVTVTDVCGITQTDTIQIFIDSSTVVRIGPDQSICKGETVDLSESGFDYYAWQPVASVNCKDCATVKAGPAASGYVVLTAGFANGCVSRDSAYITVYDTFNYHVDTTICYGRTVFWNGEEIGPNENRTFNLNTVHGCDSIVQVRVKGTTLGTFQIQVDTAVCLGETLSYNGFNLLPGEEKTFLLTAITGCDSTVFVKVMSKDTFSTKETLVICAGKTTAIFGQPQGASGIYRKTFTARNGCDSTHTVNLTVLDPILLELTSMASCANEATGSLTLLASGGNPPFSYTWDIAGAPAQPAQQNLPEGNYSVTVTDAKNCTETATEAVMAYPPLAFSVETDSVACFGEANGAIEVLTPDTTLTFSLDGSAFSQIGNFPDLKADFYTVLVQDVYGCQDTAVVKVGQPPQLVVNLPADTVLQLGDSLRLKVVDYNGPLTYVWENPAYLSCADCPRPIAKPLQTIRYVLTVQDAYGCTATDQMLVVVERVIHVFVPNVIHLNARDDFNRRFLPDFGQAVARVKSFQVFDRWGGLLHEVRNAAPGDATMAWEGIRKGDPMAPGVYIWAMELEMLDGTFEKYQGDVTVLR